MLTATNQQQLLQDADQIFEWQVEQAQNTIDALNQNLQLGQQRASYYLEQTINVPNTAEQVGITLSSAALLINYSTAVAYAIAAGTHLVPFFTFGASRFGGSPQANAATGGKPFGDSFEAGAAATKAIADAIDKTATLQVPARIGRLVREVGRAADRPRAHPDPDCRCHSRAPDRPAKPDQSPDPNRQLQKQIDFLTGKFTNQDLYDWMVGRLADTYFQSYKLAYRFCKQVERCYQFELGIQDSAFIQFGYWDSLRKGLLAGEILNHDLRRMQSSYFDQNRRRFELSRYISLGMLDPAALQRLLVTGACDFDLPESLFDNDYPGHYNRHGDCVVDKP